MVHGFSQLPVSVEKTNSWRSCCGAILQQKISTAESAEVDSGALRGTWLPWRKLEGLHFSHLSAEQQLFEQWQLLEPRSDISRVSNT